MSRLRMFQVIFIILFFGLVIIGVVKELPTMFVIGVLCLALAWVMRIARFIVRD